MEPFQSPFIGQSLQQLHAAFLGNKKPCEGAAAGFQQVPIRRPLKEQTADKPRVWTRNVFLVLDDQTRDSEDPTALVIYAADVPSAPLQTLRSDLPTTLRFLAALEAPSFDMQYATKRLPDSKGVVRNARWESWFRAGGEGEQELGLDGDVSD